MNEAQRTDDSPLLRCKGENCIVRILKYKVVIAGTIEVVGEARKGGYLQVDIAEVVAIGDKVTETKLNDIVYIPSHGGVTFPTNQLMVKLIHDDEILAYDEGNMADGEKDIADDEGEELYQDDAGTPPLAASAD